jgi:hypothetical protein
MIDFPPPIPSESRTNVMVLLRPEQAAWLRTHAGRRGVSAYMRELLTELMAQERQEIAAARRRLTCSAKGSPQATS